MDKGGMEEGSNERWKVIERIREASVYTYVHTRIRTYVHTYEHMCIQTYVQLCIVIIHAVIHAFIIRFLKKTCSIHLFTILTLMISSKIGY